ncbi:MAG: restriction endonuclease subunit S [Bacteroidales bacterium]
MSKIVKINTFFAWEQRELGEVFNYERPDEYIVKSDKYSDDYEIPVLTANKAFILGYTNENRTYKNNCIIFDDFTLDNKFVDFEFMVKSSAIKILTAKNNNYLRFAYELLNATKIEVLGHARHYISIVQPTRTFLPNTTAEQEKIGTLFSNLDNLITLHQREQKTPKKRLKTVIKRRILYEI